VRNVFHLLRVGLLLLASHGLGQVVDFEGSFALCWDNERLLSSEVTTSRVTLSTDGWVDGPLLIIRVGDLNGLDSSLTDDCLEIKVLGLGTLLRDGVTHEVDLHGLSTLDFARDISLEVAVNILGMESDLYIHIGVGVNVASLRRDGEVLSESLSVPSEVGLDVTEVAHLHGLGESAILYDISESQSVFHKLELNSMSNTRDREEYTVFFNTLNFHNHFTREGRKSGLGVKSDCDRKDFLGLQSVGSIGVNRHRHGAGCEGGRVGRSELELNCFLTLVQDGNSPSSSSSNRHNSEVSDSLVGVSQVKVEWDTLSLNQNVYLVQIVEVESDLLFVLAAFTRSEQNWDLKDVITLVRHEDLSRSKRHVKVVSLNEFRFNTEGLGVKVLHDKFLLNG